jgi:drug/metabolite transporter (DMT)-like permease
MNIVDATKFWIGIALAVIGVAVLLSSRRTRGFGQRKQAGALMLIAAVVFVVIGLGKLDL